MGWVLMLGHWVKLKFKPKINVNIYLRLLNSQFARMSLFK